MNRKSYTSNQEKKRIHQQQTFNTDRFQKNSFMRIAHYSPTTFPIDVYINDQLAVRDLDFGEKSRYYAIEPGFVKISIFPKNNKTSPLYVNTINIPGDTIISTVAINFLSNIQLQLVNDDILPIAGEIYFKFSNFSPNAPALDLLINNQLVFDNISFPRVTRYALLSRVPSNSQSDLPKYTLQIRIASTDVILLTMYDVTFEPNRSYTINVIGLYESEPPLQFNITLDGNSYILS